MCLYGPLGATYGPSRTSSDGVAVMPERLASEIDAVAARLAPEDRGRLAEARVLLRDLVGRHELTEFFTLPAYQVLG